MRNVVREDLIGTAETVCDIVQSTLGPFGTTKLVVGEDGSVTTTRSATEVLEAISLNDPVVTVLEAAATDFLDRRGDGATTMLTLTGGLLVEARRLADRGLHPTTITGGYDLAADIGIEALKEQRYSPDVVGTGAVAETALTGISNPELQSRLAEYVVEAVDRVATDLDAEESVDTTNVRTATHIGPVSETNLIPGVVLSTSPVAEDMPRSLSDVGIGLLSETVELPSVGTASSRTESDVALDVETFEERHAVAESERDVFDERLEAVVAAGCRVLVTSMAVNERVHRRLSNRGVLAVDRVDNEALAALARATGGTVVPDLTTVSSETLGWADASVDRLGGEDHIVVRSTGGESPVYTLLCRVSDPRSMTELESSVRGAIQAVTAARQDTGVVPGGGAAEVAVSRAVRRRTRSIDDRRQLAARGFADALLSVPRALATNAGLDGWDAVIALVAGHEAGRDAAVDAFGGSTADAFDLGPLADPFSIKRAAIETATETATQLIRVDDRLDATGLGDDDREEAGMTGADESAAAE